MLQCLFYGRRFDFSGYETQDCPWQTFAQGIQDHHAVIVLPDIDADQLRLKVDHAHQIGLAGIGVANYLMSPFGEHGIQQATRNGTPIDYHYF